MTTDNQPIDFQDTKSIPFGKRLQSVREAMHLERKDAAAQLRLNERIIFMMEKNRYSSDIPITFIRGYLRSYAALLNIPEHEVRKAIEHIKAKPLSQQTPPPNTKPIVIGHKNSYYFMHVFTFLIVLTLLSLIGSWWYTQNQPATVTLAANQPVINSETPIPPPVMTTATQAPESKDAQAMTNQANTTLATTDNVKTLAHKKRKLTTQSDDYDEDEED